MAVHPSIQPGELRKKAGSAGSNKGLVFAKCADQAHQNRRTARASCQEVGVSDCGSVCEQGCVRWYAGADRETPSSAWVVRGHGVVDLDGIRVPLRGSCAPRRMTSEAIMRAHAFPGEMEPTDHGMRGLGCAGWELTPSGRVVIVWLTSVVLHLWVQAI